MVSCPLGQQHPVGPGSAVVEVYSLLEVMSIWPELRRRSWLCLQVLLMSLKSEQSPERPVKDGPSPSAHRSPGKTEAKEASDDLLKRIQGFMNPDLARLTSSPLRHVLEEKVSTGQLSELAGVLC